MTANPNGIPPAFRGRQPATTGYIGLTDDQVLKIAANALRMVEMLPAGAPARQKQWDAFNAAMGELASRATVHALERIQEIRGKTGLPETGLPAAQSVSALTDLDDTKPPPRSPRWRFSRRHA